MHWWKYLRSADYCRVRRLNGCSETLCFVSLSFMPLYCVRYYLFIFYSFTSASGHEIKYVDTNSATIKFVRISLPIYTGKLHGTSMSGESL